MHAHRTFTHWSMGNERMMTNCQKQFTKFLKLTHRTNMFLLHILIVLAVLAVNLANVWPTVQTAIAAEASNESEADGASSSTNSPTRKVKTKSIAKVQVEEQTLPIGSDLTINEDGTNNPTNALSSLPASF